MTVSRENRMTLPVLIVDDNDSRFEAPLHGCPIESANKRICEQGQSGGWAQMAIATLRIVPN
jgi:hypothetical protein